MEKIVIIDENKYEIIKEYKNGFDKEEFINKYNKGIYLITMRGHITCCIDGVIYDTFYPKDRLVWEAYEV